MKKRVIIGSCVLVVLMLVLLLWIWITRPKPPQLHLILPYDGGECTVRNAEGDWFKTSFGWQVSGTMEVLDRAPIPASNICYFIVPYSEEFICELPDGECRFYALDYRFSGTGAETVTITEDGITVQGNDMEYEVSSFEGDWFEANGQGASFVTLSFSGDGATVQSDAPYALRHLDETYTDCCSITSDGAKATLYGH